VRKNLLSSCAAALGLCFIAAASTLPPPPLGLDLYMPVPEDNPLTRVSVMLGRRLFNDKRLSRDRAVACSSCHEPARAFASSAALSTGAFGRRGRRNAPSLVNRGYGRAFFWDGRTTTLEEQVLHPIRRRDEMDMTVAEAAARVTVDETTLARALASYVRSIRAGNARVDRHMSGHAGLITALELTGLQVFRGKGNCTACHVGPNFTDERFHNTGVAWRDGRFSDDGRAVVSGQDDDRGAFKTPTLREVARTSPYMHDGSIPTLEAVVDFYERGGRPNPHLDPEVRPRPFTAEDKRALVAFLRALSGELREGWK
jgi:cytochrome c peroxidase